MVKSNLIEIEVEKREPLKYPILAKNKQTREVVLFTNSQTGTIVWQPLDSVLNRLGVNFEKWLDLERNVDYWDILPKGTRIDLIQE